MSDTMPTTKTIKIWIRTRLTWRDGIGPGFPDTQQVSGYDVRYEPTAGFTKLEIEVREAHTND
jgi:hypothetical protein